MFLTNMLSCCFTSFVTYFKMTERTESKIQKFSKSSKLNDGKSFNLKKWFISKIPCLENCLNCCKKYDDVEADALESSNSSEKVETLVNENYKGKKHTLFYFADTFCSCHWRFEKLQNWTHWRPKSGWMCWWTCQWTWMSINLWYAIFGLEYQFPKW